MKEQPLIGGRGYWQVVQGYVDIFLVANLKTNPEVLKAGRRHHLLRLEKGQSICSGDYIKESGYGLLAIPSEQAVFICKEDEITNGYKKTKEALITIKKIMETKLHETSQKEIGVEESLKVLEFEVCSLIRRYYYQRHEKIKEQFYERQQQDQLAIKKGIASLADAVITETSFEEEQIKDSPLVKVCKRVGQVNKISIGLPSNVTEEVELSDIVKASRIRTRRVALKDKWWKKDHGSLVAFYESGEPVALISIKYGQYLMYDPRQDEDIPVTREVAERLDNFAYCFYRSFPSTVMTVKKIATFAMGSSNKKDLWMVALMGLLGGLLGMLTPYITGILFDKIIPQAEASQLVQVGFLMLASALGTFMFQLTRSFAMLRMEGITESTVQAAVWDRLISLPVPFYRNYSAGELATRAMAVTKIRRLLSGLATSTLLSSLFSGLNIFLLYHYSKELARVGLILVAIAVLMTAILGFAQMKLERQVIKKIEKISGLLFQLIQGIPKFRSTGVEKRAFYKWAKPFGQQRSLIFKKELIAKGMQVFNSVFPLICTMVLYYFYLKKQVELEPGRFIGFYAAFSTFLTAMLTMAETILSINTIIPIYESAKPILTTLPEYDEEKADPGTLTGEIEIKHISFRYEEKSPLVLDDVSLQIKEGEYIALVGASGSGKSTLLRLLLGFEKPDQGQIYYNDRDMSKVNLQAIRRQLGVVLQNGQLMSGTIYHNIVGSHPNLDMKDALEATKKVGLYEDIKRMPMGMHTVVSENGTTLSGGQRQRLLIARAIVNQPKILFFDEATSALDNTTQNIVQESLEAIKSTRIVIAHRLSTIKHCHRILVLEKGKIVESGTYEELMEQEGVFRKLAKRQAL